MKKAIHKRTITPHKGGRTERTPNARLTPQERDKLDKALKASGLSFADWIVSKLEE